MAVEVKIPQLGESVTEGVIVQWLKEDGAQVAADEPILELETEKATMEVTAEAAGRLHIVKPVGARVRVGEVVATIAEVAAQERADTPAQDEASNERAPARPAPAVAARATEETKRPEAAKADAKESEPVAAKAGAKESARVAPSKTDAKDSEPVPWRPREAPARAGNGGGHREQRPAAAATAPESSANMAAAARGTQGAPAARAERATDGDVERVPMSELRRTVAARLVEARQTAAILTTFNEIDLGDLLAARARNRERFKERHGVDLGLMSVFSRAIVLALQEIPVVNARIEGAEIVYNRRVHLGIAVSTRRGLVVPVIRNADRMSVPELERAIEERASRARDGRLTPDDLAGGTFTITNGGVFGSLLSTPLLNPPQSGILGMHAIQQRPVARDGQVVIRPMMYVALSYDHRLVDGEQAVTFLKRVKEFLEDPARLAFAA